MAIEEKKSLKLFYCYTQEDKVLIDELQVHLTILKQENSITEWHEGIIIPGEKWEEAITSQLQSAHLILLLVTPDFIASNYCDIVEMQHALQRHREDATRVIPLILRSCSWEKTSLSTVQVLPTNAIPVEIWPDQDDAFSDIANGIRKVIGELSLHVKTPQEWFDEGISHYNLKQKENASTELLLTLPHIAPDNNRSNQKS